MERIEDRSKALSFIGIEVADALKSIPTPVEETEEVAQEQVQVEEQQYVQETTFEVKPTLWQRFKNSKFVRAIRYVTKIKLRLDVPNALPQGQENNN